MPGHPAFGAQQLAEDERRRDPAGEGEQRADMQQGRQPERADQGQQLAAEQADADRRLLEWEQLNGWTAAPPAPASKP